MLLSGGNICEVESVLWWERKQSTELEFLLMIFPDLEGKNIRCLGLRQKCFQKEDCAYVDSVDMLNF